MGWWVDKMMLEPIEGDEGLILMGEMKVGG
jgi:hypothetical protein